jgi:CDP-paratose 2-epimerase
MEILVTGGAGFVGSSICLTLRERYPHYHITALDNLKRRGSEINQAELIKAGINFVHGDIRCKEDLDSLRSFDVMIEASAEPSVMAGLESNRSYVINNNLFGSVNCFEACLLRNAHLIFLSTSRVYPITRIENANFDEKDTRFSFAANQTEEGISTLGISERLSLRGFRSFYGTTKLAAELILEEYSEFSSLKTAITRFGVIAGPRQMGKTDQGVATLWMAKHLWNGSLKYIGYGGMGKQVRDILHIEDVCRLVDMQIHQPEKFVGKIFNAGGGLRNSLSLREMTELCEKITGNRITIDSEAQNRPADLRCFFSDNSKIEEETGWKPVRGVEKTLADIFDWLRENEGILRPVLS